MYARTKNGHQLSVGVTRDGVTSIFLAVARYEDSIEAWHVFDYEWAKLAEEFMGQNVVPFDYAAERLFEIPIVIEPSRGGANGLAVRSVGVAKHSGSGITGDYYHGGGQ